MSTTYRIHPELNSAVVWYADVIARKYLQLAAVEGHGYDEREHQLAAAALDEWLAQATKCMDAVVLAHLQTGDALP